MSQAPPTLKFKLGIPSKREVDAAAGGAQPGGPTAPSIPDKTKGAAAPHEAGVGVHMSGPPPRPPQQVATVPASTLPSAGAVQAPKPVKLKLKMPSSVVPMPSSAPGPAHIKTKRPASELDSAPGASAPGAAQKKVKLGQFAPISSKFKLKPMKGLPSGQAAAPASNGQTALLLPKPGYFPPAGLGSPGSKKRGRRPKGVDMGPTMSAGRQARRQSGDDVNYRIQAPPPRTFSLRQSASQTTFGATGVPSPISVGPLDAGVVSGSVTLQEQEADLIPAPGPPPIPPMLGPRVFPERPPSKEELARLLARIHERDSIGLFHKPVTEEVAPGYFSIIAEPMDLSKMREKLEAGAYTGWIVFDADLQLMFKNALTYNPPGDRMYAHALKIRNQADKMLYSLAFGRSGGGAAGGSGAAGPGAKTDKGAVAEHRRLTAAKKAQARAQRAAVAAAARAEQRAAQEAKVLRRAGVAGADEGEENEARASFRAPSSDTGLQAWGALGGGSSAEGGPFGFGRLVLHPSNPTPSASLYAASVERFVVGLKGRAKDLVLARVRGAREASDAVTAPSAAQEPPAATSGPNGKPSKGKKQQPQSAWTGSMGAQRAVAGLPSAPVVPSLPPVAALTGINTLPQANPAMAARAAQAMAAQVQTQVQKPLVVPGQFSLPLMAAPGGVQRPGPVMLPQGGSMSLPFLPIGGAPGIGLGGGMAAAVPTTMQQREQESRPSAV